METSQVIKTILFDFHQRSGAKLVNFSGFMLPVWFSNLKDEHMAVRQLAGIFDISHMGLIRLSGAGVSEFLQHVFCNDVEKTAGGKMVYGMILNEAAGILDDVMLGSLEDGRYLLVVNASNKQKIWEWLSAKKPDSIQLEDLNVEFGFVAVQGPASAELLDQVLGTQLQSQPRFSVRSFMVNGVSGYALRTGYTGEDGFELILSNSVIGSIWKACVDGGIRPCGLAARDTLRLEAGLPLYGQELSEKITPFMTRYRWVVALDKPFIGAQILRSEQGQIPDWVTVGLQLQERLIARSHYPILEGGEVTSGTLSPSLDKSIAMALVKPEFSELGSIVTVQIRDKFVKAQVVSVPFK